MDAFVLTAIPGRIDIEELGKKLHIAKGSHYAERIEAWAEGRL